MSVFSILKHALRPSEPSWPRSLGPAASQAEFDDVIIIGGGGHGLATAYYLAKNHGLTNIAVLEKGYIGSGNVGRNTTIIRSNYMLGANTALLREILCRCGKGFPMSLISTAWSRTAASIVVAVSPMQMDGFARRGNIMRLNGIDADLLDRRNCRRSAYSRLFQECAFPDLGRGYTSAAPAPCATMPRPGEYARATSQLGVHVIENCEVTGIIKSGNKI